MDPLLIKHKATALFIAVLFMFALHVESTADFNADVSFTAMNGNINATVVISCIKPSTMINGRIEMHYRSSYLTDGSFINWILVTERPHDFSNYHARESKFSLDSGRLEFTFIKVNYEDELGKDRGTEFEFVLADRDLTSKEDTSRIFTFKFSDYTVPDNINTESKRPTTEPTKQNEEISTQTRSDRTNYTGVYSTVFPAKETCQPQPCTPQEPYQPQTCPPQKPCQPPSLPTTEVPVSGSPPSISDKSWWLSVLLLLVGIIIGVSATYATRRYLKWRSERMPILPPAAASDNYYLNYISYYAKRLYRPAHVPVPQTPPPQPQQADDVV